MAVLNLRIILIMTKAYIVSERMFDYDDNYYHPNGYDTLKIFNEKSKSEIASSYSSLKYLAMPLL